MAKMTAGRWRGIGAAMLWLGAMTAARGAEPVLGWSAGVARVEITPDKPVWMAGYAARKTPSEGVAHPIHAKALALSDGSNRTAVLVTADPIGFDRALTEQITDRLKAKYGLLREAVALFSSHTHSGPALRNVELHLRESGIDPKQAQANLDYRNELEDKIVALVGSALARRGPAALVYGVGRVGFAMNWREKTAHGFQIGVNPDGPTDPSVPVLSVTDDKGTPLAVVFGYACHNTTLTDKMMQLSGDYAGFAQSALEENYPGVTAMFITGCAEDANPHSRGTLDLAWSVARPDPGRSGRGGPDSADTSAFRPLSDTDHGKEVCG
jgi:neutral ceramidase